MKIARTLFIIFSTLLVSCSYNPFIADNHLTGSPTAALVGAGVGAGGAALLGAPKSALIPAGIIGGAIGYYVTTLRFDAGGIINAGGEVYQIGDFVGIYLPTDCLFESNTDDLLPQATPILNSVAVVLKRYPSKNIIISGNTSGFYCARWEQNLSERRARKVAAFLWSAGINNFEEGGANFRKLTYVGYGDYFRITSNQHLNRSIRANSRIQITAYPSDCDLGLAGRDTVYSNVGAI